jgi:nucleotide-binding universal stress UspA family protein
MSTNQSTRIALVAFDGSPSAIAALNWASTHAPLLGLDIEVVNVWEYAESPLDIAGVGFGTSAYVGESDPKIWSDQILKSGVGLVFGLNSDQIKTTSIEGGVVRTLVELSKGAELLVMGSRGHGKFADLILGSVSESCSAKSKCPVVIVHA